MAKNSEAVLTLLHTQATTGAGGRAGYLLTSSQKDLSEVPDRHVVNSLREDGTQEPRALGVL